MTDHRNTSEEVRDALFRVMELQDHPDRLELERYSAGDLSEKEQDEVVEHLSMCPSCSKISLDLSLGETNGSAAPPWLTAPGTAQAPAGFLRSSRLLAAAAVLFAFTATVGWWRAERAVRHVSKSALGELSLREVRLAAVRGAEVETVDLKGAERTALLVHLPATRAGQRFQIQLEDTEAGQLLWAAELSADEFGTIPVHLPGFVLEGRGELELVARGVETDSEWSVWIVP